MPVETTDTLVIGAGQAAFDLVGSILRDPRKQWHPVGLLDDDPPPGRLGGLQLGNRAVGHEPA